MGGHAPSIATYKQAEHERLIELREEVDLAERWRTPTVTEFASAVVHPNGRITMTWPEGQRAHKETGRRPSTVRRMRDGLKPLVRDFGDRAARTGRRGVAALQKNHAAAAIELQYTRTTKSTPTALAEPQTSAKRGFSTLWPPS